MLDGALRIPRNPLRAWFATSWWLALASLGTSVVSGSVAIIVIALLTLTVVTLPFALVGVLIFALLISPLRYADRAQLWSVEFFSGVHTDRVSPPSVANIRGRFVESVRSPSLWKSLLHWILRLPLSVAVLVLVTAQLIVPVVFAVAPVAWIITDPPGSQLEIAEMFTLELVILIAVPAALWFVLVTPPLVTGLARADWWFSRSLLGASAQETRVEELTHSRTRVIDAAEAERLRIERDLHDGAQQRLVAVSISLGHAKSRAKSSDDALLRSLLDDAHRETRNAIADIRALTRGLHPPILTDRGLDAALSSVAALCSVPVGIKIASELSGTSRPTATMESTIYFLVSEALTNVTKHSQATSATVSVERLGQSLKIEVCDNGHGGAAIQLGGGLAGLADRLSGVDGSLHIESPTGGPTSITVEVPCG
ncbi:histidine kinase [Rhodococcus sp. NPDC057135]|uniref:sensor histidine kinase n=1 Tax=Rhodococcus sp. NPDC057135 TaxID=3346028 RepID=UPI00362E36BE